MVFVGEDILSTIHDSASVADNGGLLGEQLQQGHG